MLGRSYLALVPRTDDPSLDNRLEMDIVRQDIHRACDGVAGRCRRLAVVEEHRCGRIRARFGQSAARY